MIIVGAGLSGICTAWHLQQRCPDDEFLILEAREDVGGTWDLFRYPGVRSDSDMPTLGYAFRPWLDREAIASGPRIKRYISNTATEHGLLERIQFDRQLIAADWDSRAQIWTLRVRDKAGGEHRYRTRFLMLCTGYYDYAQGYEPEFIEKERFTGQWIHPQFWPPDLSLRDQRVAVIGSGATAITLVPSLADEAAAVTMVQRTPSFIAEMPARDALSRWCHRWLGARVAHFITRWKNIAYTMYVFQMSRRFPKLVRRQITQVVRERIEHVCDVDKHFNPPYNPWDQRLCLAPDGDFFDAIAEGKAEVATGEIAGFDARAIRLKDSTRIDADVIVCATGLKLKVAGGATLRVDGQRVKANECMSYKGAMLGGVPNLALTMGYTNASWTLKCELIARWFVRLRRYMQRQGHAVVTPADVSGKDARPLLDLDSGYIRRAADILPRQGEHAPWQVHQNYLLDIAAFRFSRIDDGYLRFAAATDVAGSNSR